MSDESKDGSNTADEEQLPQEGGAPSDEISSDDASEPDAADDSIGRRDFTRQATASVGAVALSAAGLGAGFLWPRASRDPIAVFTCMVREVPIGAVKEIKSPRGERIYLTRTEDSLDAAHVLAIGSTCSHLGCKVFYRPGNTDEQRFHCPCHQGFFDSLGNPTGGPPERALTRYDVEVRGDLLFIKYMQV